MNQSIIIMLLSLGYMLYVFYNQVRVRKVAGDSKLTLPLIMFVIGAVIFKQYLESGQVTMISWICIIISFTLLAVGMAAVRASTVRIWQEQGIIYRQGTWLTVVLWIVSILLHIAVNRMGNVGESTSLIYFAITFSVQKAIIKDRASRLVGDQTQSRNQF